MFDFKDVGHLCLTLWRRRWFEHVQRSDGAYLANGKLRPHSTTGKAENLEDQRDLWIEPNRTWGLYEVHEKRKGWMEAERLLEKGNEAVKHSAKIKMSLCPTQFIGVKLIKGDCRHWHYKMLIPIKDDIQKLFCLFNSNDSGAHCAR